MLMEKLKQEKDEGKKLEQKTGGCRFCGQSAVLHVPKEWKEDDCDELATEQCDCTSATYYTARKRRKEKAHERIEYMFGEKTELEQIGEEAVELLHEAVEKIGDEIIMQATIKVRDGIKASIELTSKDKIKVVRTKTIRSAYEE